MHILAGTRGTSGGAFIVRPERVSRYSSGPIQKPPYNFVIFQMQNASALPYENIQYTTDQRRHLYNYINTGDEKHLDRMWGFDSARMSFAMTMELQDIEGYKFAAVNTSSMFAASSLGAVVFDQLMKAPAFYSSLASKSPVKIPSSASINDQMKKGGYRQIKYKWSDSTYKYEARWHTRTPRAPKGARPSWVIERITPGTPTGQQRVHHILTGSNQWTPMYQWEAAKNAYNNNTATPAQLLLLQNGHWEAPQ